jgi:hypothetical protein
VVRAYERSRGFGVSIPHESESFVQTFFFRSLLVSALVLVAAVAAQNASADLGDTLRWQSVIGIVQGNNVVGTGTVAVTGGGTRWSTLGGHANVDPDSGKLNFDVTGSGNGIRA